jgi:nucleotide-binding universal stress UspA family protein
MSYRKILVPVIGAASDKAALSAAFALAKQFGAHAEALFVRLDPVRAVPYGYIGGDVSGYSAQYAIEAAIKASDEAQKLALEAFRATAGKLAIGLKQKPGALPDPTAHLKVVQGDFADEIERESRLSDLVVFGLVPNGEGQDTIREGFEAALLSGTHPVLCVPAEPTESPGQRIAIAYDGSATAAHAVMAALPFLSRAKAVHSFEITLATGDSEPLTELREYLALRGIGVIEHLVDPGPKSTAEALLLAVEAQRCDMLVLGGYGHSRIREFVLGGVTRHIARNGAPFAVLMAH